MALIEPTILESSSYHGIRSRVVHWDAIGQGDTCSPVKVIGFKDITAGADGTFSGSATIAIHGANHPTVPVYSALTDPSDNNISFSADKNEVIMQNTYWIKPVIASGDGSTDINVTLICYSRN